MNLGVTFKISSYSEKGRSKENGIELKKVYSRRSKKVNIVGVHCRPGFKCFSFCVLVSKLSHEDRLANSIYR